MIHFVHSSSIKLNDDGIVCICVNHDLKRFGRALSKSYVVVGVGEGVHCFFM